MTNTTDQTATEDLNGASRLAGRVDTELERSLRILDQHLARLEKDLDLGCENLQHLVNNRNPAIGKQLALLQGRLSDLHDSLDEVRTRLESASGGTTQLRDLLPSGSAGTPGDKEPADDESTLHPKVASAMRHDEEITFAGIVRALLMADEPGQRV